MSRPKRSVMAEMSFNGRIDPLTDSQRRRAVLTLLRRLGPEARDVLDALGLIQCTSGRYVILPDPFAKTKTES